MFRHLQTLDVGSRAHRRQREAIIERCLPLADHIARRYRDRGECLDDLVQIARLGLVNAVDRFDADHGSGFLSFAVPTIMGEVRRHFRDYGWAVKVPRRLKELQSQVRRASGDLARQLHRAPNASEIAAHLGIERALVVDTMIAASNYTVLSIDMQTDPGDDGCSVLDTLGALDPRLDNVLRVEAARPLIAALPERERTVLRLRFFEDMTQSEIAKRIGCSQMHVSRLLAQALESLRDGTFQPSVSAAS